MSPVHLVLASASPRRAELLRLAGISFDIHLAKVDESVRVGETPGEHVRRLAEEKARAVMLQVGERPVLAADTVVVVDGVILGKPTDAEETRRMLRMLSGRTHEVLTGVCLACVASAPSARRGPDGLAPHECTTRVAVTTVEFAALSDAEVHWYVASGEPEGKAGAYAIQGLASRFVTRIDGSYSNVVGLPVGLVYDLCKRAGLLLF